MRTVQTPVLVLMDNPAPVSQFYISLKKPEQIRQRYFISDNLLKGFNKFLTHLIIVQLIHTEHNSSFTRKRSSYLFPIHQPERTSHSFFNKISRPAIFTGLYQQVFSREMADCHIFFQHLYCIIGNRIQRTHHIYYIRHNP